VANYFLDNSFGLLNPRLLNLPAEETFISVMEKTVASNLVTVAGYFPDFVRVLADQIARHKESCLHPVFVEDRKKPVQSLLLADLAIRNNWIVLDRIESQQA
jgi:hypothetical protein